MPSDLFGDVTDPSIKVGSRKWYTVPLSLIVHSFVVVVIVVVPLLATGALPMPPSHDVFVTEVVTPLPPPPPAIRRAVVKQTPARNADAAPLVAPSTIEKETGLEQGFDTGVGDVVAVDAIGVFGSVDVVPEPPPPPPIPQKLYRVGGEIKPPQKTHDIAPVYPTVAQLARVEGMVIIEATIGIDGRVRDARILRSAPLSVLDQAALAAVREWIYTPTTLNGQPVSVVMTVTVRFQLR